MPAQAMLVAIGLLAAGRLFKPSVARGLSRRRREGADRGGGLPLGR
jgi:hypothetical protein